PRVRRLRVIVEGYVLGDRELEHEPSSLPVLGDMPDARVERLPRGGMLEAAPGDGHAAAVDPLETGQRVYQLGLAVSVDTRDPDDLPRANVERNAADFLDPAVVADVQVADFEEYVARLAGLLLDAKEHFPPDHRLRERLLGCALARHGLDGLAAP